LVALDPFAEHAGRHGPALRRDLQTIVADECPRRAENPDATFRVGGGLRLLLSRHDPIRRGGRWWPMQFRPQECGRFRFPRACRREVIECVDDAGLVGLHTAALRSLRYRDEVRMSICSLSSVGRVVGAVRFDLPEPLLRSGDGGRDRVSPRSISTKIVCRWATARRSPERSFAVLPAQPELDVFVLPPPHS